MSKVLVLFAHPALEKSRIHSRLINAATNHSLITFRDLYEVYPDFFIDIKKEQQLLLKHDIIVFQHPFYWYSTPSIIKEWMDLVLEHNWAYGSSGTALMGKKWMHAISCGGSRQSYSAAGMNRYSVRQLLIPFQQTSLLCKMDFIPPYVVHGTHKLNDEDIDRTVETYRKILVALAEDKFSVDQFEQANYINDVEIFQ